MSTSFTIAPSIVVARPRVESFTDAAWPMHTVQGCTGHTSVNLGNTTGTTESKRLTPGDLIGVLT